MRSEDYALCRTQYPARNPLRLLQHRNGASFSQKHLALVDGKLSKNVKIQYSVNPAIIGGMILRADEYLLDVSVSGTSEKLREGIA